MTGAATRIMALDYGRKRIGVAVSDPSRTIATPLDTVERAGGPPVPPRLLDLVSETRPCAILVGIPRQMDGRDGAMAVEARAFARGVEAATGVEVIEWDERLSSARAEREIRDMGASRSRRRDRRIVDQLAASLMLTDFLRSAAAIEIGRHAEPGDENPENTGPTGPTRT